MSLSDVSVKDLSMLLKETGFSYFSDGKTSFFYVDSREYLNEPENDFKIMIKNLVKNYGFKENNNCGLNTILISKDTDYGAINIRCVSIDSEEERDPCLMYSHWNPAPITHKFRFEVKFPDISFSEVKEVLSKTGYKEIINEHKLKDEEFERRINEFRKRN